MILCQATKVFEKMFKTWCYFKCAQIDYGTILLKKYIFAFLCFTIEVYEKVSCKALIATRWMKHNYSIFT